MPVRPSLIPFLRKHDFVVSYAPRYIVMIVDLPRKEMTTLVFFYLLFPPLIISLLKLYSPWLLNPWIFHDDIC